MVGVEIWLGGDQERYDLAVRLFEEFCKTLLTDSAQARVQLISRIQVGFEMAYNQGRDDAQVECANAFDGLG